MGMDLFLGIFVGAVIGIGLTFLLNKTSGDTSASSVKKLKKEHDEYRKQVDDHFVNSAMLLKGLTEQYRDVYRHIATGAGELCSDEAKALQVEMEETALLAKTEEADVVSEQVKETVCEESSASDGDELEEAKEADVKAVAPEASELKEEPVGDDIPLASEVEIPVEVTEEIKSEASKKS